MPTQEKQIKLKNDRKDQNAFLEQYKLALTMADKISDRRGTNNHFFIALNTFLVSIVSFQKDFGLLSFMGVAICVIWLFLLKTYGDLNKVKFDIIQEIEKELPLNLMQYEWNQLCKNKHKPFTQREKYIPLVLIILYLCILGYHIMG